MFEDTRSKHGTQLPKAICDLRKNDPWQESEGPRKPSPHNPPSTRGNHARMKPRKLAGLALYPGKIEFRLLAPM